MGNRVSYPAYRRGAYMGVDFGCFAGCRADWKTIHALHGSKDNCKSGKVQIKLTVDCFVSLAMTHFL